MTLVERLLAAISKTEQDAGRYHRDDCDWFENRWHYPCQCPGTPHSPTDPCGCGHPEEIRRGCAWDRKILEEHGDEHMCFENTHDGNTWDYYIGDCRIVRHIAAGYGITEEDTDG